MNNKQEYSSYQLIGLVILRIFIGWHFLYEGMVKLFNPGWSSVGFLMESKWIFSGFFHWIASNFTLLNVVDTLNEWGLFFIGLGLIVGLFTRYASIFGGVLLLFYFLATPPLIGIEYSIPSEGSYLIINKTLIEAITLFVLALLPQTSSIFGLDYFIEILRKKK